MSAPARAAAGLYLGLLLLAGPGDAKMGDDPATSAAPRAGWWPALAAKQAREMKSADEQVSCGALAARCTGQHRHKQTMLVAGQGCSGCCRCSKRAAPPAALPAAAAAAAAATASPSSLPTLQGGVQLLLLGDSITESWRGTDGGKACNARYRSSCGGWGRARARKRRWRGSRSCGSAWLRQGPRRYQSAPSQRPTAALALSICGCRRIASVFKRHFGQYRTSVQAIGGDQVMHLVYRMEHGALPKASQASGRHFAGAGRSAAGAGEGAGWGGGALPAALQPLAALALASTPPWLLLLPPPPPAHSRAWLCC